MKICALFYNGNHKLFYWNVTNQRLTKWLTAKPAKKKKKVKYMRSKSIKYKINDHLIEFVLWISSDKELSEQNCINYGVKLVTDLHEQYNIKQIDFYCCTQIKQLQQDNKQQFRHNYTNDPSYTNSNDPYKLCGTINLKKVQKLKQLSFNCDIDIIHIFYNDVKMDYGYRHLSYLNDKRYTEFVENKHIWHRSIKLDANIKYKWYFSKKEVRKFGKKENPRSPNFGIDNNWYLECSPYGFNLKIVLFKFPVNILCLKYELNIKCNVKKNMCKTAKMIYFMNRSCGGAFYECQPFSAGDMLSIKNDLWFDIDMKLLYVGTGHHLKKQWNEYGIY